MKKIVALLLILCFVFALVACDDNKPVDANKPGDITTDGETDPSTDPSDADTTETTGTQETTGSQETTGDGKKPPNWTEGKDPDDGWEGAEFYPIGGKK